MTAVVAWTWGRWGLFMFQPNPPRLEHKKERGTFSEEAAGPLQEHMVLLTRVGVLHQDPQGVGVHALHLHLVLLGLPHVAGEHRRKVVGHGREDQPAWAREHVSHHSERMDREQNTLTLVSTWV